jgi:hypothetical protein
LLSFLFKLDYTAPVIATDRFAFTNAVTVAVSVPLVGYGWNGPTWDIRSDNLSRQSDIAMPYAVVAVSHLRVADIESLTSILP